MRTRTHVASDPLLSLRSCTVDQRVSAKPRGFWYSVDGGWEEWCASEMPEWVQGMVRHSVDLDTSKILVVEGEEALDAFDKKYSLGMESPYKNNAILDHCNIDWPRVAKEFDGIEIPEYAWGRRHTFMWYYGWDCASGCVWNTRAIRSIKVLEGVAK